MQPRERITRIINHQPVDRVGIYESFWWQTEEEFRQQGMPDNISAAEHFPLDAGMYWFDQSFQLPEQTLEENDDTRVFTDGWGATLREFKTHQTPPQHLDHVIKSNQQWEELKPRLEYSSARLDWDEVHACYQRIENAGKYRILSVIESFECTTPMLGFTKHMMLHVTDINWLADIYQTHMKLILNAMEDMHASGLEWDCLWLYGDIAYKSGTFLSPSAYRELLFPLHSKLCDAAHSLGMQVVYHCDGNFNAIIPMLIEAGVDCLQPMEVKAGMDIFELKTKYGGQLAFMGNIDTRLFQFNDLAALENEIREKVGFAMQGGGYIFHSDHSIAPGTKMKTYEYAQDLVQEIGKY